LGERVACLGLLITLARVSLRADSGVAEFVEKPLALSRPQINAEGSPDSGRKARPVPYIAAEVGGVALKHLVDFFELVCSEFWRGTRPLLVS